MCIDRGVLVGFLLNFYLYKISETFFAATKLVLNLTLLRSIQTFDMYYLVKFRQGKQLRKWENSKRERNALKAFFCRRFIQHDQLFTWKSISVYKILLDLFIKGDQPSFRIKASNYRNCCFNFTMEKDVVIIFNYSHYLNNFLKCIFIF